MFSKRAEQITPFIVMEILEKAQALERMGIDVVHMEIGEPDFPTPEVVVKAGVDSLLSGNTKYTHSLGLFELRQEIAGYYMRRYGVKVEPDHILISSGTSPAMAMIFSAIIDPGDEIIIPDPYYPCYPNFVRFFGGKPIFVQLDEEDGFNIDVNKIKKKITKRTKALIINSPSNPTGNVIPPSILKEIASLEIPVISDEIYHGISYEKQENTMLEFREDAIVINGFSKSYAMTGWRLGFVIAPRNFIRVLQKVQQNFLISPNPFVQKAGISAIRDAESQRSMMRESFRKRRDLIVDGLRKIGFKIPTLPGGAFYVFARSDAFAPDSYELCINILNSAHVAVSPGSDFSQRGKIFLRFSYATSDERIGEGLKRLERFLRRV